MLEVLAEESRFPSLNVDREMTLAVSGELTRYSLYGTVYLSHNSHFTSRFFLPDGSVWYHDGIGTGSSVQRQYGELDVSEAHGARVCCVMYVREQ